MSGWDVWHEWCEKYDDMSGMRWYKCCEWYDVMNGMMRWILTYVNVCICWLIGGVQFITVGFAVTPLYFVWEKLLGIHHTKHVLFRAICRMPVILPIWFFAIAFPFFGPINSAVGALLVTFTVYIIPCLAHMVYYRSPAARTVCTLLPHLRWVQILNFAHLLGSFFVHLSIIVFLSRIVGLQCIWNDF
jgi:hypothetical protein